MLLQASYLIRLKPQMMERLDFDLLFRWIAGLGVEDPRCDRSNFYKTVASCSGATSPRGCCRRSSPGNR
jgi:hypothetical protein